MNSYCIEHQEDYNVTVKKAFRLRLGFVLLIY